MPFISCAFPHRSIIRIGGADRRAFLQGLVSNDIEQVTPQQAVYAALLTPQGKFLHDMFIVESGEDFLMDCEAARAEDLLKRLATYKLRAKITLANAVDEFEVWASFSPLSFPRKRESSASDSEHIMPAVHAANAEESLTRGRASMDSRVRGNDTIYYDDPRLPDLGLRVIVRIGNELDNTVRLSDYDRHRLALGVPDGSRDMIVEKSTLTDGNFDLLNGISWTKGCYIGQELTARMHYRALVKKRMFPVRIEGPAPEPGTIVKAGNEDVGEMRSSAGDMGLALLNIEKAEATIAANAALSCGTARLMPSKPEWMNEKKD